MSPRHHFGEELLVEHAAGAMKPGTALVVDCHVAVCDACRSRAAELQALGGQLLERTEAPPLPPELLERVMGRLDEPAPISARPAVPPPEGAGWPRPLLARLPPGKLRWRTVVPGVRAVDLSLGGEERVRLFRLRPGIGISEHDHGGAEHTLILSGGIADAERTLHAGDALSMAPGDRHEQRVLPDEECFALVAQEGPLVPLTLTGKLIKLVGGF